MLLDTDIPYLEPLLFHLQDDPVLKNFFTQFSFFMPKDGIAAAVAELKGSDCPAPRSIWILPQDGVAINGKNSVTQNCIPAVRHSFNILLFVSCIRDPFQVTFRDGKAFLNGTYMEMSAIRKAVMKSVAEFNKKNNAEISGRSFENVMFEKYQSLYPQEGDPFLVNNLDYSVTIF